MTRKLDEPCYGYCIVCERVKRLLYIDLTMSQRGFCQDCMDHVISADYYLNRWGLKDPPPGLTYSARHRL